MSLKNIEDAYALSPMQQGMLFHSLSAPESGVYVEQMCFELHGSLNVAAFTQAWQQVIARHSVLRTACVWENLETPLQVVGRQVTLPRQELDWRRISSKEQQDKLAALLQSDRKRGFQLSQAPLMRLLLIRLADEVYHFIWSHHHLLLDGWSVAIILQEAIAYYKGFCEGKQSHLPTSRPYRDYIAWLQQQDISQAEAFWRKALSGFTSPTLLGDFTTNQSHQNYTEQELRLSAATTTALNAFVKQHHLTLNILVQGAWALLLNRYSREQDVVFGATVSGRPPALVNVESMVGLFINTLPVRTQISPQLELLRWLQQLLAQQIEASQYEYTPLIDIQKWSQVSSGVPLFDSIVVFENYPVDAALAQPDLNVEIRNVFGFEQTNYPLTLGVAPGQELSLKLAYQESDRFDAVSITRMLGHLQTLLEGMVANPHQRLEQLSILTPAERNYLLVEWNDTQTQYPQTKCIHELFESQVEQTPDAVAVVFANQHITYRELNHKANQLAHHLQTLGVRPEVMVGICVERSFEMVIGILGILKAGGAYVPLDPQLPQERLAWMLEDANLQVLVTQLPLTTKLPPHLAQIVCLDDDIWQTMPEVTNPLNITSLANLAYVIYTSGSTGTPKGVSIEHRSLVNFTQAAVTEYEITPQDRILQFASISFDAACEEIFPCLVQGATLVLRTDQMLASLSIFLEKCCQQSISVLDLPTAFWHQLTTELSTSKLALPKSLRLVIIGGEKALPYQVMAWHQGGQSQIRLVNSYGPTEATVVATICELAATNIQGEVPIGRPIANVETYILDANLQLVPIGIAGELYIGGLGVARGYLHQPKLTDEKFISNPFKLGSRLYKTGDLGRYRQDGQLEFLGRIDNQVKIHGFRIELGEVETRLEQHPHVDQAVVVLRDDEIGNKRLVAYVSPCSQKILTSTELRGFLQQKLPSYMLPSAFIILSNFPLTPNGKVDRQALPEPATLRPELEVGYVMPQTELETTIAAAWHKILKIENIGIHDNFFELGGHSLLIAKLHSQLNGIIPTDFSILDLFRYPTISTLAEYLSEANNQASSIQETHIATEKIEVIKAQQRKRLQKMKSISNT